LKYTLTLQLNSSTCNNM